MALCIALQWKEHSECSVVTEHCTVLSNNVLAKTFENQHRVYQVLSLGGYMSYWAMRWRSWLRHCATSRKYAGSIPDGLIGIFH
jgi:hypothetical protein